MSLLWLAWRQLVAGGTKHMLTVLTLALGVGLMVATAATADAARAALSTVAARYPLVVGGPVGAVPLVLGSLTRLQDLSAGVDHAVYEELAADPDVEVAVPLLAGHAVESHPLLATTPDYLQPRSRFPLSQGRVFAEGTQEVVLGVEAAAGLGVSLGDELVIEHQHAGAPDDPGALRVVGVLGRTDTDADRTLFTSLEAIYASHEHAHAGHTAPDALHDHDAGHEHDDDAHHDQDASHDHPTGRRVSSILVRPVDDAALLAIQERLADRPGVEVALTGQTLRRVSDQLSSGGQLIQVLVSGVVVLTFLSLLLSVYGSSLAQARDIAVMRLLGASRLQVVAVVLLISLTLIAAGTGGGLAIAAVMADGAESILRERMGLEATVVLLSPTALQLLGVMALLLAVAGAQPAFEAYTLSAAQGLSSTGAGRARRAYLRRAMTLLIPLGILVWLQWAMGQHSTEAGVPVPLDADSQALFETLATEGAALPVSPDEIVTVRGWMYAVGDPFEVQDFYLVGLNPHLPRCPFCYRAPTARERIHVHTGGRTLDLASSMVEVEGRLRAGDGPDPWVLELTSFEVVIP